MDGDSKISATICVHVHVHVHTYVRVHVHVCVHVHVHVCMCMCIHVRLRTAIHACAAISMAKNGQAVTASMFLKDSMYPNIRQRRMPLTKQTTSDASDQNEKKTKSSQAETPLFVKSS